MSSLIRWIEFPFRPAVALRAPASRGVRWVAVISVIAGGLSLAACEEEGLQGAQAEVKETSIKLDLPPVPKFEMPSPHSDGTHSVREMRLKGRKLFNTQLEIRGFVTWKYDCIAAVRKLDMSDKQVAKLIDDDPTLCTRPHFYIGDAADTPPDKSVWVVDVPRKLRKDELKRLTREERRNLPPVPSVALGDEVVVKGTWDKQSSTGFSNSDGLLIYASLEPVGAGSGDGGGDGDGDGADEE